jgi:septal ring factor EnvC (AmiA/AmiB activator)
MDVEKTIEFILETLADSAAWRAETERRMARTDRQIHGIQTLLKMGARQLIGLTAAQKRTDQAIRKLSADVAELRVMANDMMASISRMSASVDKLTAAQRRTDERFQRWLDRGHNGKR